MDTRATEAVTPEQVQARLEEIKRHMPETYKAIQRKAAEIGREAFRFVRQGVAGQPNRFYAMERGWVVGHPFDLPGVSEGMAVNICQFGATHWIMWAPDAQKPQGDANGTH
jgi:hypothetical protein